ncbi:MAG: hypothetical protein ABR884_02200 [Minisyncoccia bacterium]|jgi:hypothetical protein
MATASILFIGKPEMLGGLSNEEQLVKECPPEFHKDNPWSNYASELFFKGGKIANWKWKSDDPTERRRQMNCFDGLLGTFGIGHNEKESVAGWMLSEMLAEVPEYVPPEKNDPAR